MERLIRGKRGFLAVLVVAAAVGVMGPSVASGRAEGAAVNPYRGAQDRQQVFKFAQRPTVRKEGDAYVITFAATGRCDVTVAVIGPDDRVVRHLASGVLGPNAPRPFQQDSLEQRIEWDGRDDLGKPAPAGCAVRVGLGLKVTFDRTIGYDAHHLPLGPGGSQRPEAKEYKDKCLVARGPKGETYVLGTPTRGGLVGRVFDAEGKYLRTFWPVAADDLPKLTNVGYQFATTIWGEKALISRWFGPTLLQRDPRKQTLEAIGRPMFATAGIETYEMATRPAGLPASALPQAFRDFWRSKQLRMTVDRVRDDLYIGHPGMSLARVNGRTGEPDPNWFKDGGLDRVSEVCVGADGLVYISTGACGYGQFITRLDRSGQPVNFDGDAVPLPMRGRWEDGRGQYGDMEGRKIFGSSVCPLALKGTGEIRSLWTGHFGHSNTHERGLYVSPNGTVLAAVQYPDAAWAVKHGVPNDAPRSERSVGSGRLPTVHTSYVVVWDRDGRLLTANAVGDMQNGHGVAMDADGSIYAAMGGRVPESQQHYWGLTDRPLRGHFDHGSLLKFRGGMPFPRGRAHYGKDAPDSAVRLKGYRGKVTAIEGADWIFGGLMSQRPDICTCHNLRYDMDYFARHWLPANHLYSVMVLDANGNRIARIGRYGNVDDTARDVKEGRDGVRFVWPRAVAVSDKALYVADHGSRRILKAAIGYAVEETVSLP